MINKICLESAWTVASLSSPILSQKTLWRNYGLILKEKIWILFVVYNLHIYFHISIWNILRNLEAIYNSINTNFLRW